jgi:hypothetical protein
MNLFLSAQCPSELCDLIDSFLIKCVDCCHGEDVICFKDVCEFCSEWRCLLCSSNCAICAHRFCQDCTHECRWHENCKICLTCVTETCSRCAISCFPVRYCRCDWPYCKNCGYVCTICNKIKCKNCRFRCDRCNSPLCKPCVWYCVDCGMSTCGECRCKCGSRKRKKS